MTILQNMGAVGLAAALLTAFAVFPPAVSAQNASTASHLPLSRVASQAARHRLYSRSLSANTVREPPASDFGRGFDGYDRRPGVGVNYGAASVVSPSGNGLDDPTEPSYGYGIGLPAYVYPLGSSGSPFDDGPIYGAGSLDAARIAATVGGMCTTPVKTCVLYKQSYVGIACSCRASGGRVDGQVTP